MYLQGATFERGEGEEAFSADPELAEKRNGGLAPGVTIASPPAFYWDEGGFYGRIFNSRLTRAYARLLQRHLNRAHERESHLKTSLPGRWMGWHLPRLAASMTTSPLMAPAYNPANVEPDVVVSLMRWATDDISAGMLHQMFGIFVDGDYRSYDGNYSYTENMHRISSPLLFITGFRDSANPDNIRKYGYERISSGKKELLNFPLYGHTDLVMGKGVGETVYPAIADWLIRTVEDQKAVDRR